MEKPKEGVRYCTTKALAEHLQVSRVTIFRWIKEGKINAIKNGRTYLVSEGAVQIFKFKYLAPQEVRDRARDALRQLVQDLSDEDMKRLRGTSPDISDIDEID